MKRTRRHYDREFKISIIAELEGGTSLAQVSSKYGIHPSLPDSWREELAEKPQESVQL